MRVKLGWRMGFPMMADAIHVVMEDGSLFLMANPTHFAKKCHSLWVSRIRLFHWYGIKNPILYAVAFPEFGIKCFSLAKNGTEGQKMRERSQKMREIPHRKK